MNTEIKKIFENEKIEYVGVIPFDKCKVVNQQLCERLFIDFRPKSVIVFLMPYYSGEYPERNISLYAIPKDYHKYFKDLSINLENELEKSFSGKSFKGCSDHSPIDERHAAASCGLGVLGDKCTLINEKYGSYTFIGEIFTDFELTEYEVFDVELCDHCGRCTEACPSKDSCLSAVTQKKGELTFEETSLVKKCGSAWGCDVCSSVCPKNADISITPIEFFKENLTPVLTSSMIESMGEKEFKERAYSWRTKQTIIRNLKILES